MFDRIRGNWGFIPAAVITACFSAGCGDEGQFPATALIQGQVVDLAGNGIFQIDVGVVYEVQVVSSALSPRVGASATLLAPYPNPITTDFIPLKIRVQTASATTARVEVVGFVSGISGTILTLHQGVVPPDTTVIWDGTDIFSIMVPNGLYKIRVTIPATSAEGAQTDEERTVIVNRPTAVMVLKEDLFNTSSGLDGRYVLDDLAVGESFTATADNGVILGAAFLLDRVTVIFRDSAYQDNQSLVSIGPGEIVDLVTQLTPIVTKPYPITDSQ